MVCSASGFSFEENIQFTQNMRRHFETHNRVQHYPCHTNMVHSVDWNCDGRKLASGSFDKTVAMFSLGPDKLIREHTLKGHTDSVDQLCWFPQSAHQLCTASLDRTVRLWDSRTSKSTSIISTKGENINICMSPDGRTIAVGNKEDVVTLIDVRAGRIRAEHAFKFEVNELSWNHDATALFLTSGSGHVHVFDWPSMQTLTRLHAHTATCICIEFDPTGRYFAVGSADANVSIWDAYELACVRTICRLEWPARTVSFSHDGRLLASASEDLVVDVSCVETGDQVAEIRTAAPVFTVAFHPSRLLLAFACDDKEHIQRDRETCAIRLFGFSSDHD